MKKTISFFLLATTFVALNSLNASALAIEETGPTKPQARSSLVIENFSDSILLVELSPTKDPKGVPSYTWHVDPKEEGKTHHAATLVQYTFAPGLTNCLTEFDRYGVLSISITHAVENDTGARQQADSIFHGFVDTSGTFSYHSPTNFSYKTHS